MLIFFFGFLAGIMWSWANSYNSHLEIGINRFTLMVTLTFLGAFFSKLLLPLTPVITALKIGLGVLAAYFLRIIFDTTFVDPTSHNLWPFEIIMISIIVFPAAFAGVYLAQLSKWLKQKLNYFL